MSRGGLYSTDRYYDYVRKWHGVILDFIHHIIKMQPFIYHRTPTPKQKRAVMPP